MLSRFKSLLALPVRPLVSSSQKQTQRMMSTASSREILKNLQETPLAINIRPITPSPHSQPNANDSLRTKSHYLNPIHPRQSDFRLLRNIFWGIISQLTIIQNELQSRPNFEILNDAIISARNENDLIAILYSSKKSTSLNLRPWNEIRSDLLSNPIFKEPLRFREQCYFIMRDPLAFGIKFRHDAKLINQHTDYLFHSKRKKVSMEECYQDTLNELTDALSEGRYQETIKKMRRLIDVYEQARQVEENSNLRMQENQRMRMRRWVG